MSAKFVQLDASGWTEIGALLSDRQGNSSITSNLLRHLKSLNAQSAIVEDEYLDRDFTDAFSAHYSRLFKRHSKVCVRILLFSADIEAALKLTSYQKQSEQLEEIGRTNFLGFIVLRPISQAPIAQVVLKAPPAPPTLESHLLVKSEIHVHSLGATFSVEGIPMTQQDQRIGACAQAAIWTCARHFYYRHRGPWMSMVGVNKAAMTKATWGLSKTIPSGSEYLSIQEMVTALEDCGRKVLTYVADEFDPVKWKNVRPADVINRYVDSGIPVILFYAGQPIGHVVVATGQILRESPRSNQLPLKPTRAEFCEAFLINDDQGGPNLRLSVERGSPFAESNLIANEVSALLVGLPDKVYLSAEQAEMLSWDYLGKYASDWDAWKKAQHTFLGKSSQLGDELVKSFTDGKVIARTYLTYGWKYKARSMRNTLSEAAKEIARSTELPRYVWITEFGTLDSFSGADPNKRKIFSHCVVDATAKNMGADSRLIFHAPGHAFTNQHDPTKPGAYKQSLYPITDDLPYSPKRRGSMNFN